MNNPLAGRKACPTEEMISDEKLNELADWFLKSRMGTILDITFCQYLEQQKYYDELFDAVKDGHALTRLPDGRQEIVSSSGIMQRIGERING